MVSPMYFQPLSFQDANPYLTAIQTGQAIRAQALKDQLSQIQNQFAQPMAQQALQEAQQKNQQLGIQNKYLPQDMQSQIGLRNAQAGQVGAQTNLLRQSTPFLLQQEQGKVFSDPVMQRLYELQQAQTTGAISPQMLSSIGLGTNQQDGLSTPTNTVNSQLQQLMPTNGVNPVTAPKLFNGDAGTNWAMFGTPYNPLTYSALKTGMDTNAQTAVTEYNDAQKKAADSADVATQGVKFVDQFLNNYDKSTMKGSILGRVPAFGAAEQAADNASQNLAALVAKAIAGGRVTNYEMQYVNALKPNRTMQPQTALMAANYLKQKFIRMNEQQDFLNAARSLGLDVQTANSLWQQYNNQRPVYNFSTNTPYTQFQKTWKDYLTPQAINAVKAGKNYVPIPSFASKTQYQNWLRTIPESDRTTLIDQLSQEGR